MQLSTRCNRSCETAPGPQRNNKSVSSTQKVWNDDKCRGCGRLVPRYYDLFGVRYAAKNHQDMSLPFHLQSWRHLRRHYSQGLQIGNLEVTQHSKSHNIRWKYKVRPRSHQLRVDLQVSAPAPESFQCLADWRRSRRVKSTPQTKKIDIDTKYIVR